MNQEPRIDTVGIGTQRSGSTWVFRALEKHPEVTTADRPNNKELNFFNFNYHKGYDWYHDLFGDRSSPCVDYSILYWSHPAVPERLHRYNPGAKLVLSLRDPIERAFSQHKLQLRRNRVPEHYLPFEEALERNPTYRNQGRYASHLKEYLEYFEFDSIHVILFEDIVKRPDETVRSLYEFLDVDDSVQPEHLERRSNPSKSFRLDTLKELRFGVAGFLRSVFGTWSVEAIKSTGLPTLMRSLNQQPPEATITPPKPETVRQLREELQPEVEELETLTGLDLSHWLDPNFEPNH